MHPRFRWIGKSADGTTVTLKRFDGVFRAADHATPDWLAANADLVRVGVALDVETTGLNRKTDAVIEIGLREFRFNRATGEIVGAGRGLSALQDPGKPLDEDISRLTGLTDEMLKGRRIDWSEVDAVLAGAQLVIAHNASFDRPFVERSTPSSGSKVWACSYRHIDWSAKGFGTSKLELLAIYHGFFTDSHRAGTDADALVHLLTLDDPTTHQPYLLELLRNARRPMVRVVAAQSPFESKDFLKERGYTWDTAARAWERLLFRDLLEPELAWLEAVVYNGRFLGATHEIALSDNFK